MILEKKFINLGDYTVSTINSSKRIAIIGGGPCGLFTFKRFVEASVNNITIDIFEKTDRLGCGMPYSHYGANDEHITNVSGNEIPEIVTSIKEWLQTVPQNTLQHFNIDNNFSDYKVLPRLLFGQYLSAQFDLLVERAARQGMNVHIHLKTQVVDIIDLHNRSLVEIVDVSGKRYVHDHVIISTGHFWPRKRENSLPGYFDSPYPPSKLMMPIDHPVAIRGASLTAVDAIRTLARQNGSFKKDGDGKLIYTLKHADSKFRIMLHTRHGLLPAVRFHLEDSHLRNDSLLTSEELREHMEKNDGFLSLDYIFEKDFKNIFLEKDPDFYQRIRHMNVEEFVSHMMEIREHVMPFDLIRAEYVEAEKSIKRKQSIYWKEMLGVLSFAMNYPAKHLSAEDMIRLQKVLLPLISIVIAYIPQSSTLELLAIHNAGLLDIVAVGEDSEITQANGGGVIYKYRNENGEFKSIHYQTFIDCIGQPHLGLADFPFRSLVADGVVSQARIKFRSESAGKSMLDEGNNLVEFDGNAYYLKVPGIAINDRFQVIDKYGAFNDRIYIMAVPFIGGHNPDYSGLDFCEAVSAIVTKSILEQ